MGYASCTRVRITAGLESRSVPLHAHAEAAVGSPEAFATTRTFWLMFAVLDVVRVGLILFARAFTATRRDAAQAAW